CGRRQMGPDDAPLPRVGARHQVALLPPLKVRSARGFRGRSRSRQHARAQGNPARIVDRLRRVPRMSVRSVKLRRFAKGAGAVLVGVIAVDLVMTAATLAFGWSVFWR